ncbi:MAG: DNA repair protein RecO [Coriobacteriia bacterium]|nr:DNA repair protein RecO [Coriobacteriia bacterium]
MTSRRVRALSLKKTKLGETDLIVTFLAEDGCQVRAVAKGARKPGSRLGGRVEPYVVADLLLHEGRSLDTISDVEIAVSHSGVRTDYDRSTAASVLVDFLDKISVECQTEDRLFGLACASLDAIETASATGLTPLVTAFLVKGIAMHGYRPQFGACAICGSDSGASTLFSLENAGPLCEDCSLHEHATVIASLEVRHLLSAYLGARMTEVAGIEASPRLVVDAFVLARRLVAYHVPARLKALDLYAATVGDALP